ncbi:universal stress protein [Mycolicibacterium pallens]|uniref:Universal stress protein n=1 Tax=Mycolicibacterium pallens TaxID=370524 RepID=A0ABX8VMW1_9MYCO|nr:universal stress protein [Mycolicibacterium pallens]QYL19120.1 universal stress protein [Mycolicibacterium pallens]
MAATTTHHGIIVGVDGSPAAQVAVGWAVREAALHKVPLTLLHVVSPTVSVFPGVEVPSGFEVWQQDEGRDILQSARAMACRVTEADPIEINSEMMNGVAAITLADLSKDAQLVVVGAHGRGRARRLLGSVSSALSHHGHCPVAVIHDDNVYPPAAAPVVVGIDGSPCSESATAIAFDEASRRGVELVAVHACTNWDGWNYPDVDWPAIESQGEEVLGERLAGWGERYPDVVVRRVVVGHGAADRLIEESKQAQLIVVGSHGRGGFAGMLLGSVSAAVVQSVRIPVLIARGQ